MKYPQEQLDKVVQHLPVILSVLFKVKVSDILFTNSLLFKLHFILYVQLTYPPDNPNVMNKEGKRLSEFGGERLLPLDTNFLLYPGDCIDLHVHTAMKKAVRCLQK